MTDLNFTYIFLFVSCVIVIKYGAWAFVLSKTVKSLDYREKIDALFTIGVLTFVCWVHRNGTLHITNAHIGLNLLYVMLAVMLYYAVNIVIGEYFGSGKSRNQQQIENLTKAVPFGISLFCTGLLAPLFEEVVFRFYIQDLLFENTVMGILAASFLFALMHMLAGFSISGLLTYTGVSIVVGVVYKLTGGLLFSSIMHIIVNSLAVVFMYYGEKLKGLCQEEI